MHTTSPTLLDCLRKSGNGVVWERFSHLYTPLLFSWAKRLGLSDDDAGDLVQDVFVVLVRRMPEFTYDPSRSFRAWLRTVIQNKWREHVRRRADWIANNDAIDDVVDHQDDFQDLEEAEYRRHVVGGALRALRSEFSSQHWQAFTGYVLDGRDVGDVAAQSGLSVNAIYLVKSRVLRRLRSDLGGLLD